MINQHSEIVICPNCQYPNAVEAEYCERCGNRLLRTVPITTAQFTATKDIKPEQAEQIYGLASTQGAVTLLVAGHPEPLIIHKSGDIVLGRRMPNESAPTVDMTKYNGHLLGVSRRHAIISFSSNNYTLEDLNSTNGTWLNENKLSPNQLYPLKGGDQIRLGNLIMFVYFSVVTPIHLIDSQGASSTTHILTPRYLEKTLAPYLSALVEMQHVIDSILERQSSTTIIRSINAGAINAVQVKMDGTAEAVQFVREYVEPWKKTHTHTLLLAQAGQISKTNGLDQTLSEEYAGLAKGLVIKLKPTLLGSEAANHIQNLLGPLRILTNSSLEITNTLQS